MRFHVYYEMGGDTLETTLMTPRDENGLFTLVNAALKPKPQRFEEVYLSRGLPFFDKKTRLFQLFKLISNLFSRIPLALL